MSEPDAKSSERSWTSNVMLLSLLGAVTMWCVQPPLQWGLLAVFAPVPWLLLVQMRELNGKRPRLAIYFGAFVHSLLLVQGIRHPHWMLIVGWIALAAYLALYPLLFVMLTRAAVHRARLPLGLAAPAVWVALEFARAHALTGYGLALLGHAVVNYPVAIQVANLGGAYLVGAIVMLGATVVTTWISLRQEDSKNSQRETALATHAKWTTAVAIGVIAAALVYGRLELEPSPFATILATEETTVALVQGARDVFYEYDPKANQEMYMDYRVRSRQAVDENPDIKFVIWPESSLRADLPEVVIDGDLLVPIDEESLDNKQYQARVQLGVDEFRARLRVLTVDVAPAGGVDFLVSGETIHAEGRDVDRYNSAILLRDNGVVEQRYYKMHPVMFGEYIPFGETFPWLYSWTPMHGGIKRGPNPVAMEVDGLTISPSICFETTIPHLIRKQVARLRREGRMPDVLVNPSNDGWFHGSSILDLHANCMVFRAVENGRPLLAAANGGLTSWIDAKGRVKGRLKRKTKEVLIAKVGPGDGVTIYQRIGDLFAWLCVAITLLGAVQKTRADKAA